MTLEKLGVPTITFCSSAFTNLAVGQAKVLGIPSLRTVILPHPIAGTSWESVREKVDAALDEIVAKITSPVAAAESLSSAPVREPQTLEVAGDLEEINLEFLERGWGDGLPLIPPTEARVAAMLRGTDREPGFPVGAVQPRMRLATVEKIAVNAVMAGCQPRHMPLLIAAVQALIAEPFNLYAIQATTHPVGPLLVVNGPLRETLGIHSGNNVFGPGPWSNGVVGRAIRLILLNLGGGTPGEVDKATLGHPGKYSYCIAENEENSPWINLARERAFPEGVSTVTVVGAEGPHNINDQESVTANGLLTMIAGAMAETGQNNVYYEGEPLLILAPEHAATLSGEGFTKDDVRSFLYDQARIPMYRFSRENIENRLRRKQPKRYLHMSENTMVPVAQRPSDIMLVVAGGVGRHSQYVPTFGATRSVTMSISKADGEPYRPTDFAV